MTQKTSRKALKVWARLGMWYGSKLADNYGPTPPDDWAELIDRTDEERLGEALLAVRRETPIFPPTLGQLEAAIPRPRVTSWSEPSKPQQIAELMLNRDLCKHQLASRWTFFGPMREFPVPSSKPPVTFSHPDPRGVVVAECAECGKSSYRALLDEAVGPGVAA